jgi:hypothetical protein
MFCFSFVVFFFQLYNSFITNDVAQVEDFRWSKGPSSEQIMHITEVFKQFDASTGYMSVSALHAFMCKLPQPFGFLDEHGDLDITDSDRVYELLIRAELNVILTTIRQNRENDAKKPFFRRIFRVPKLPEKRVYVMDVSYMQVTDYDMILLP